MLDATSYAMSGAHPYRPDDNEREQKRPDPPQPPDDAIARPESEKRKARNAEAQGREERPGLRLICASTSQLEEHQHPEGERDEGCTRDHILTSAGEHAEDEINPRISPPAMEPKTTSPMWPPRFFLVFRRRGVAAPAGPAIGLLRRTLRTSWNERLYNQSTTLYSGRLAAMHLLSPNCLAPTKG